MEDNYRLTVDQIYMTLVNNGDISASDDDTVVTIRKGMIGDDMEQCMKELDLIDPTYEFLSSLIRDNLRELEENSNTLSERRKLTLHVENYVIYRYQSMIVARHNN